MVSHAHITRLRPRHAYFSADSGCDRSGVAINVIFLIFIQIVTVWILAPGHIKESRYGVNAHIDATEFDDCRSVLIFRSIICTDRLINSSYSLFQSPNTF